MKGHSLSMFWKGRGGSSGHVFQSAVQIESRRLIGPQCRVPPMLVDAVEGVE